MTAWSNGSAEYALASSVHTVAPGAACFLTNPWRMGLSVKATTLAATFLLARAFAPTTAGLPAAPPPILSFLDSCLLVSLPPK